MSRRIVLFFCCGLVFSPKVQGAVQVVDDFGANGWYSWDTRNSGTQLVGTNDTSPLWPAVHTPADDVAIEKQIKFLGENQTATDAAGGTPDPSPTGSLNGLGYVRLDGTSANSGKSDISYLNAAGIAPAAALADPLSFGGAYRYYTDSNPTSRTPGLNIATVDPADPSKVFTFNHVQAPYTPDAWNIEGVDSSNSLFSLFGQGAPGGATSKSLVDWFSDPTWGPQLSNDVIFRVGFNVGSSQRNALIYVDWLAISLLNNGDAIDFQGPAAVPEGSSMIVWLVIAGLAGMGAKGKLGFGSMQPLLAYLRSSRTRS